MLSKQEQDPHITLQSMSEECQMITNQKQDLAQIEEPEVQMEIQAVKKIPANEPPSKSSLQMQ